MTITPNPNRQPSSASTSQTAPRPQNPASPPSLPASDFEAIVPLLTIIERTLASLTSQVGALAAEVAPGGPLPLSIKEFTSEVLRAKHELSAARLQLRGLSDVQRSIAEQRAEEARLRRRLELAQEMRFEIGQRAELMVREISDEQATKDGELAKNDNKEKKDDA